MSIYHEAPTKTTAPPSSLRHCYCACQWSGPVYVAMCGHSQADSPRWVDDVPTDACVVCVDVMQGDCPVCGTAAE